MNPAWVFYIILNMTVLGHVESTSLESCNRIRDWTYKGWYDERKGDHNSFALELTRCQWRGEAWPE